MGGKTRTDRYSTLAEILLNKVHDFVASHADVRRGSSRVPGLFTVPSLVLNVVVVVVFHVDL